MLPTIRRALLPPVAVLAAIATFSVGAAETPQPDRAAAEAAFRRDVAPVLRSRCGKCHGPEKQEASLRLDTLGTDLADSRDGETWHDVLTRLNRGEMPPKGTPALTEAERRTVVDWLTAEMRRTAAERRSTGGRVVLRRLTRYEYANTLRDLLGIDMDFAADLPPESPSDEGFLNNGSRLGISASQVETYLHVARSALGRALVEGPAPQVVRFSADKPVVDGQKPKQNAKTKAPGSVAGEAGRIGSDARFVVRLEDFPREGEFRVRVTAAGMRPEGFGHPRMQVTLGVRADTLYPQKVLGEADVAAPVDAPGTYEFRGRIEDFPLPGRNPKFPGLLVGVYNVSDRDKAEALKKRPGNPQAKKNDKGPPQPEIDVRSVEFEGPLFDAWPPSSHVRILFAAEPPADERDYVAEVLRRFLRRAYRRPVGEGDVAPLLTFFERARPQSASFVEAVRETLAMALVSPDFLFLMEPRDDSVAGPQPLSDFELASRTSYFLWSTLPDDELSRLAEAGTLRDPAVLETQVRRMLADRRSRNLVEHFAAQWLNLGGLSRVAVNPEYHPQFDERLKQDMREETVRFFAEVLDRDLSAKTFIASDFAMLNRPLAEHYGLSGPLGQEFERVPLKPEDGRGGLLTQGSMLLTNSTGEDSHPIRRAVWLLDRLLDDPPPPPPPDVPPLDQGKAKDFAKLPLKKQLELHREREACNSCHRRIDPWGIPFEGYDAVGLRRTEVLRIAKGSRTRTAVDSHAVLPSGDEVRDVRDLQRHLLEKEQDRFGRALTARLLSYALGRSLEPVDRPVVDELHASFAAADLKLSRLIVAIVASPAFRSK